MEAQAQTSLSWWAVTLSITVGYFAACIVGAYFLGFALTIPDFILKTDVRFVNFLGWFFYWIEQSLGVSILISVICLPLFLTLRFILYLGERLDPLSFAIAGAITPLLLIEFLYLFAKGSPDRFPLHVFLSLAGALAGAVSCLTERWIWNRFFNAET